MIQILIFNSQSGTTPYPTGMPVRYLQQRSEAL